MREFNIGSTIPFGDYTWLIIDIGLKEKMKITVRE